MPLTAKARELLARCHQRKSSSKWSQRSGSGVLYPEFKLIYCPRKSGVVWMARFRRRNLSEHTTRDEAIKALEAIKKAASLKL